MYFQRLLQNCALPCGAGGLQEIAKKCKQFEISLDYLHEFNFEPVTTTDEHFVKYDEPIAFIVRGKTVIVESDTLAAALLRLPKKAAGSAVFAVLSRLQRRGNQ